MNVVGGFDAPIVVVGDAPTVDEATFETPFYGALWEIMADVLEQTGFELSDVVFVNCVQFQKYHKKGPLTAKDILPDAKQHLIPFLAAHPRKLVIALGNNAVCAVGLEKKPERFTVHSGRRGESQLLREAGVDAIVTASMHPYMLRKEPERARDMVADLRRAKRLLENDYNEQVPTEIRDIFKPSDVNRIFDALKKNPYLAYDFETTGKNRDKDYPVTVSFCNGLKNQSNEFIAWYWQGYDQLVPLYDDATMRQFVEAFDDLFSQAGSAYDLIAFNATFDDWIAERWVGHELPGSQYDAMLMKWSVDNRRPHGLKEATTRYLGYADYDKAVDEAVREIKHRRSKVLTDLSDFRVLELFGHTPKSSISKKTKKPTYRWPDNVDKGLAMYALQPNATLRLYNCYDSVYTYLLWEKFGQEIMLNDLSYSCDFRHRVARELMRCEQRGMLCDVETNRQFSRRLEEIEKECELQIADELRKMGEDRPDFNHRSGPQLIEVLYGKPTLLPFIDRGPLYRELKEREVNADAACDSVEETVYVDVETVPKVRALVESGMDVDVDEIKQRLSKTFARRYKDLQVGFYDEAYYMGGRYEPLAFTKTGAPSTAASVLQTLYTDNPSPFLSLVLMARRANKLRGTFVDSIYKKLDSVNILRPRFNPIGTETGRISSSEPNGQNFQKYIRGQLISRPGYKFLEWDLSQAEIRAIAAESGDPALIAALGSDSKYDIHTRIASMIFNIPEEEVRRDTHRRYAKTIVFGLIYGMGAWRLSLALGISLEEADEFISDFFAAFPRMYEYLKEQVRLASRYPYYVYTAWGTRRSTRNVLSIDKKIVAHTERTATNMPIQGDAGELTLWYICEMMDAIRARAFDAHLVNTTHDSCTLEVAESLLEWDEVPDDKGGVTIVPAGEFVDAVKRVLSMPPPVHPLDIVPWTADIEVTSYWSVKPDLEKALDPNLGDENSYFRWDLIKPREVLDSSELEELIEVEEATSGKSTI